MATNRHPGVHEYADERVLLVTRDKATGQERCDWWTSVEEAEASNMEVLEVREKMTVDKTAEFKGMMWWARALLGKAGAQNTFIRSRGIDAQEFFESAADKKKPSRRKWLKKD